MQLRVKRLTVSAVLPNYAKPGDSGLDLYACADLEIPPGETRLVPTGIAIELPAGTEGQVRPRSGLARDHAVTVLNAPGTIDEGYRGEVGVILVNHGRRAFAVTAGMRIAQLVVQPRYEVRVVEADSLTSTDRGAGGFGSTGR
jgi:dUTP pyrophosphatase